MSEPVPSALQTDWRRLDPRMLLVHPINELVQFLPAVIAAFLFGDVASESRWVQVIAVLAPILLGLARYLTTSYRISPTHVEVKRGLLSRKILTAPIDRVRTVELTSPLIHRLLGLAKVQIGTASGGSGPMSDKLELDSLPQAEGRALRSSLLHRAEGGSQGFEARSQSDTRTSTTEVDPSPDFVLLRLVPSWARYAPLTSTGLAIAGVGLGALVQFGGPLVDGFDLDPHLPSVAGPVLVALAFVALILFAGLCAVLSVVSYLVSNWQFTVSRDAQGRSFHITRGLFTTRETSLDIARVHGVTVLEPLGLRAAGAGRLDAVATGLGRLEDSSAVVVPPAPRYVVDGVAGLVLADEGALATPMAGHGSRATRRRWIRGLAGAVVLATAWSVGAWLLDLPMAVHAVGVLFVAGNAWMAHDRARRLGHALTPRYALFRSGSLLGRTTALQRSGIIGWNLEQTWFQRRAGLVTVTATTSAGDQSYGVYDVPEGEAVRFTDEATPGLLDEFLVR